MSLLILAGRTSPALNIPSDNQGKPAKQPHSARAYGQHCMNLVRDDVTAEQPFLAALFTQEIALLPLVSAVHGKPRTHDALKNLRASQFWAFLLI